VVLQVCIPCNGAVLCSLSQPVGLRQRQNHRKTRRAPCPSSFLPHHQHRSLPFRSTKVHLLRRCARCFLSLVRSNACAFASPADVGALCVPCALRPLIFLLVKFAVFSPSPYFVTHGTIIDLTNAQATWSSNFYDVFLIMPTIKIPSSLCSFSSERTPCFSLLFINSSRFLELYTISHLTPSLFSIVVDLRVPVSSESSRPWIS
jgi:hypothetical protein